MALTTRALARRLVTVATLGTLACYSAGGGNAPPPRSFYFPVGLAVSRSGNVLYAVNSDFDLQWNGGTLQSYDLFRLRRDAAVLIHANETGQTPPGGSQGEWPATADTFASGSIPFVAPWQGGCPGSPQPTRTDGTGSHEPLGETCSPPVDSTFYVRDSAIIGAFATDLQLSADGRRLFAPVRGEGGVAYANVALDDGTKTPGPTDTTATFAAFALDCGPRGSDNRCNAAFTVGNDIDALDTRQVTMPGEPFGLAQSEDGTALAVTHQTQTATSLLTSGIGGNPPSMQFVLTNMPSGGNGIAAVPHDPYAVDRCQDAHGSQPPNTEPCVGQAFLQTSRATAELDLLRYFPDDGSTLQRPFLQKEQAYALTANSGGTDSRGIVIDPSPRLRCQAQLGPNPSMADLATCGRRPARVFFANRTPPSLVVGQIGVQSPVDGSYDPDRLELLGNIPVGVPGPSIVKLAPIIDQDGHYALRVFLVCFDANQIYVIDPDAGQHGEVESVIDAGPGPFALAFDPFDFGAVARGDLAPTFDPRYAPELSVRPYRFAYVANFTQSFVEVIDLDDSRPSQETFEQVVFTVGHPTLPKGQGG